LTTLVVSARRRDPTIVAQEDEAFMVRREVT